MIKNCMVLLVMNCMELDIDLVNICSILGNIVYIFDLGGKSIGL